ncbi:hypothetical protein K461DRAFT_44141 [Myriangium duriaei CBS 260.36]|uniref:Myb-like domain-containing protein n=1 Tax=Myriangium duriaei CBS 260.36 TaxID=1168546 RepID=A0A9P4ISN4_9PEZI|nr:hypothetical protein K461DRAFT_44141 [Myriangium duriaei CBS 260.36]
MPRRSSRIADVDDAEQDNRSDLNRTPTPRQLRGRRTANTDSAREIAETPQQHDEDDNIPIPDSAAETASPIGNDTDDSEERIDAGPPAKFQGAVWRGNQGQGAGPSRPAAEGKMLARKVAASTKKRKEEKVIADGEEEEEEEEERVIEDNGGEAGEAGDDDWAGEDGNDNKRAGKRASGTAGKKKTTTSKKTATAVKKTTASKKAPAGKETAVNKKPSLIVKLKTGKKPTASNNNNNNNNNSGGNTSNPGNGNPSDPTTGSTRTRNTWDLAEDRELENLISHGNVGQKLTDELNRWRRVRGLPDRSPASVYTRRRNLQLRAVAREAAQAAETQPPRRKKQRKG